MPVAVRVPIALAISSKPFCMFLLPMPALVSDRQSISRIWPADSAWDNWNAALEAAAEVVPDAAASFEKPLIMLVASSTLMPALVNRPMFLVMSPKL